jgi:hypothetical protein
MNLNTNKNRQRKFKAKMYDAGFKQISLWIKDKAIKRAFNFESFIIRVESLLSGFKSDEQSKLFALIIKILEGKKEVLKLKKDNKKPGA